MKGLVGLVGYPSAAGRAQDRESSPVKDRRSTTVPRNQPTSLPSHVLAPDVRHVIQIWRLTALDPHICATWNSADVTRLRICWWTENIWRFRTPLSCGGLTECGLAYCVSRTLLIVFRLFHASLASCRPPVISSQLPSSIVGGPTIEHAWWVYVGLACFIALRNCIVTQEPDVNFVISLRACSDGNL